MAEGVKEFVEAEVGEPGEQIGVSLLMHSAIGVSGIDEDSAVSGTYLAAELYHGDVRFPLFFYLYLVNLNSEVRY